MSGLEASRQFWDEKARENPYWYVSSAGPYEGRNLAEFWASGPKIWNDLKSASGYEPTSNDTVVEIGCGVGRLTRAIAPEVGKILAFDLSAEMLAIARSSVEAATLRSMGRRLRRWRRSPTNRSTRSSHIASFSICPTLTCCGRI